MKLLINPGRPSAIATLIGTVLGSVLCTALPSISMAAEIAGKTIIARGNVYATETTTAKDRKLRRRSPIYGVDVVKTDANSKTQLRMTDGGMIALKENSELVISKYEFDAAFGGARRDEEKSRAKERVFSFRSVQHRWDPKNQRPELWNLYNARKHKGESIRVFPLSNWTELDVWQYIYLENIPIVPLYLAAKRPVVDVDGTLIMVDDDRMPIEEGQKVEERVVRFRTLGCYPLTGAVESTAATLPEIIQEMLLATTSERQGRVIDHDQSGSMEEKKRKG